MRRLALLSVIVLTFSCGREGGKADEGLEATPPSATTTGITGGSVSAMANADKEFVTKAAQSGLAEVTMGQLGTQKATHPDVRAFAARMATDHSKANDELSQLATLKGLALPSEPDEPHKEAADHVSALRGAEFDKTYMTHMVDDHVKVVADFQDASKNVEDVDLKAWVVKTLPTLEEHLGVARQVQQKLTGSGRR
jgi:putative membrane protein